MAVKQFEKATVGEKISGYMLRHRIPIIAASATVVIAIVVYTVAALVISKASEKNIAGIDAIEYELTHDSSLLSEAELEERRETALAALAQYLNKSGIAGARANMLAADIAFQRNEYEDAKLYWERVVSQSKKSYLVPLAYYNIGVCCEELGDFGNAALNYGNAVGADDFLLTSHALFSSGRAYELNDDVAKAAETYRKLEDMALNDNWTSLAKTRLIALKAKGIIE
ncbi:MAG: tetratricopeptide repeat protein [Treponema sp.]|nr:tetratricopeptide repeat protein [Treponema sp.]